MGTEPVLVLSRTLTRRHVKIQDELSGQSLTVDSQIITRWLRSIKETLEIEFQSPDLVVARHPGGLVRIEYGGFQLIFSKMEADNFVDRVTLGGEYSQLM